MLVAAGAGGRSPSRRGGAPASSPRRVHPVPCRAAAPRCRQVAISRTAAGRELSVLKRSRSGRPGSPPRLCAAPHLAAASRGEARGRGLRCRRPLRTGAENGNESPSCECPSLFRSKSPNRVNFWGGCVSFRGRSASKPGCERYLVPRCLTCEVHEGRASAPSLGLFCADTLQKECCSLAGI